MAAMLYSVHMSMHGKRAAWVVASAYMVFIILIGVAALLSMLSVYSVLFLVFVLCGFYGWYLRRYEWKSGNYKGGN
jgi:4-amino-4-deoxy-L-arabinose transferase-like glycosyltransferase